MRPDAPIFLHSQWRSGSTYFFDVFRRARKTYFAYQEPVHETMLTARDDREILISMKAASSTWMRHPVLDEDYFHEAYLNYDSWHHLITKGMIYDRYFDQTPDPDLVNFFKALEMASPQRAVFQECRTSCRIAPLKKAMDGLHIFLWRNPWDQWWSYKISDYFCAANQIICNADNAPASVAAFIRTSGVPSFRSDSIHEELRYYAHRPLAHDTGYQCFFLLWCHAWLHARQAADIMVNIDTLTFSADAAPRLNAEFEQAGIPALPFNDCNIYTAPFGSSDREFFVRNEDAIYDLLLLDKYDSSLIDEMKESRVVHRPPSQSRTKIHESLGRARQAVARLEDEAARIAGDFRQEQRELENGYQEQLGRAQAVSEQLKQKLDTTEAHLNIEKEKVEQGLKSIVTLQSDRAQEVATYIARLDFQVEGARAAAEEFERKLNQIREERDLEKEKVESGLNSVIALETAHRKEIAEHAARFEDATSNQANHIMQLTEQLFSIYKSRRWRLISLMKFGAEGHFPTPRGDRSPISLEAELLPSTTLSTVETGGIASPDTQETSMTLEELLSLPTAAFVRAAYPILLNRSVDESGLRHHTGKILMGYGRFNFLRDLANSAEGRNAGSHRDLLSLDGPALVNATYRRFLGRAPDDAGLRFYVERLGKNGNKAKFVKDVASSQEALAKQPPSIRLASQIRSMCKPKPRWGLVPKLLGQAEITRTLNQLIEQTHFAGRASSALTGGSDNAFVAGMADEPSRPKPPIKKPNPGTNLMEQLMAHIREDVSNRKSALQTASDAGIAKPQRDYDAIAVQVKTLIR